MWPQSQHLSLKAVSRPIKASASLVSDGLTNALVSEMRVSDSYASYISSVEFFSLT